MLLWKAEGLIAMQKMVYNIVYFSRKLLIQKLDCNEWGFLFNTLLYVEIWSKQGARVIFAEKDGRREAFN